MEKIRDQGSFNLSGSFNKNYSSSLYSFIEQKVADIEKVPISANTVKFKDSKIEQKFIQSLFFDSDPNLHASKEFKANLIFLYLFFSGYIIATALQDLFLFRQFLIENQIYMFKTLFLGLLSAVYFSVLNAILKSLSILKRAPEIFTLLALVIVSYIVITDFRVLFSISSGSGPQVQIYHPTLCILIFSLLFSRLLFENFLNILVISVYAFTSTSLALILSQPSNLIQFVPELTFLLISLAHLCFTSYKQSVVARDYFWRNELKSKNSEDVSDSSDLNDLNDVTNKNYINTEIELVVQLCEKIKKCIKRRLLAINLQRCQSETQSGFERIR